MLNDTRNANQDVQGKLVLAQSQFSLIYCTARVFASFVKFFVLTVRSCPGFGWDRVNYIDTL